MMEITIFIAFVDVSPLPSRTPYLAALPYANSPSRSIGSLRVEAAARMRVKRTSCTIPRSRWVDLLPLYASKLFLRRNRPSRVWKRATKYPPRNVGNVNEKRRTAAVRIVVLQKGTVRVLRNNTGKSNEIMTVVHALDRRNDLSHDYRLWLNVRPVRTAPRVSHRPKCWEMRESE